MDEWVWITGTSRRKPKYSEKACPSATYSLQISHGRTGGWIWASSKRDRRLNGWALFPGRGSTAGFQRFSMKNSSGLITTCSAFGQEGKLLYICCSTGELLSDLLQVINTANLCLASVTDYYPSRNASGHRFWVKQEMVHSVYRYCNPILREHTNVL